MWRSLVVAVGLAVAAGCSSSAPTSNAPTQLTIERKTGTATVLVPTEATLACDGTADGTGFLELESAAREACALIETGVIGQIASEQRTPRLCDQVYGGPQSAHITGTVDKRRVTLDITRNDGCGTAEWQTLAALLGDPQKQGAPTARAAPKTAATTTTAPPTTYQVRRGETLTDIAKQFGVSIAAIVAINQLPDPDRLADGQTLLIPPKPPVQLDVMPTTGPVGTKFAFALSGAHPSENVTFEIGAPGGTFTGPPHPASADGLVAATYETRVGSATGIYNVIARGDQGTAAQAVFRVDDPNAPPTSTAR